MIKTALVALVVSSIGVVACSSSPGEQTAASQEAMRCLDCPDPPPPPPPPHCSSPATACGYHCANLSNDPANCGACGVTCAGTCVNGACSPIVYQGGSVVPNAAVIAVYVGDPDPTFRQQMDHFYAAIQADGRYLQWLGEYSTPTQSIGSGTFAGSVVVPAPGGVSDEAGLGAYLDNLIHVGTLPQTSPNTVFMMHLAPGVQVISGAAVFGLPAGVPPGGSPGWCAMHLLFRSFGTGRGFTTPPIVYSILPNIPSCGTDIGTQTYMASHELVEAVTDPTSVWIDGGLPLIGMGTNAWVDPARTTFLNPIEIADKCPGDRRTLTTTAGESFTVAAAWSNTRARCFSP
jgi:hypothetical protein